MDELINKYLPLLPMLTSEQFECLKSLIEESYNMGREDLEAENGDFYNSNSEW